MKDYLTAIVIPFYPIPQKKVTTFHVFDATHPWNHPFFHPFLVVCLKKHGPISTRKNWPPRGVKKTWAEVPSWMNDDLYEAEQIPKPGGCILKLKVNGWDGGDGGEGRKFPPWKPKKIHSMNMNGREMKWQLLNQPIHFQGRSVGVHVFFVVGLMCGGWMVRISIACIFCCKVDRVATFESACPSLCKEINYLSTESVFSKFLWTQLGHLGCWFELPGQDSINIMWLACTFLVEGYDYFFWGGKLLAPTVDVHQPCLLTTRLPRRQKNWTRNQGTYQMFSGSFDGTTSTGSCFLPNKKPFAMRNLEFMISRDKNIMRVGWHPDFDHLTTFFPKTWFLLDHRRKILSSKQSCRWTLEPLRLHSGSDRACPYDPARVSVARFWSIRLDVVKSVTVTKRKNLFPLVQKVPITLSELPPPKNKQDNGKTWKNNIWRSISH